MAKDKSKNSKGEKTAKASSNQFANPSEAVGGGDSWGFEKEGNIGKLFLISPLHIKDDAVGFEGAISEVIVADIVELDEKKPEKSERHDSAWVWGGWTKGSLRSFVGKRLVLARLQQDKAKGRGNNAAWVLEDADADDMKVAEAYLAAYDAFAQPGGESAEKGKGKTEKGGKKKKKK